MKKLIIILAVLFLIFISCDTTDPKPPEEKPPGYQEDIHWPSLADSPWPMYHGDPQATGRLKGEIPVFNKIEKQIEEYFSVSAPVVGEDSCFYFISSQFPSGLICLTQEGERKWIYSLPRGYGADGVSSPLVTNSGDIIFGYNRTDSIYSISSSGKLNWRVSLKCRNELNIGEDGTIYAFSTVPKALNAISSSGNIIWSLEDPDLYTLSTAISPVGNTVYSLGVNGIALIAIDLNSKNIKWKIKAEEPDIYRNATPLVDYQGNIYVIMREVGRDTNGIYSYSENGNLRWHVILPDVGTDEPFNPVMDRNGNIYVGTKILYAIDYTGNIVWQKDFIQLSNELLVDNRENLLFATNELTEFWLETLIQINGKGDIINKISLPNFTGAQYFAPAVGYTSILMPLSYAQDAVLFIK